MYVVKCVDGKYAVANVKDQRIVSVHTSLIGAIVLANTLNL